MRRLVLNLTTSLDGFIADPRGGIDWLAEMPDEIPEDYLELVDGLDTLVMGRGTYETSLELEGGLQVFEGRTSYVFTRATDLPVADGVTFVHEDAVAFVTDLKQRLGGGIWLFGGGQLATALSDAGLVDEYLIAIQPVLLGDGIPLWVAPHANTALTLSMVRAWPGGIAELRYTRA